MDCFLLHVQLIFSSSSAFGNLITLMHLLSTLNSTFLSTLDLIMLHCRIQLKFKEFVIHTTYYFTQLRCFIHLVELKIQFKDLVINAHNTYYFYTIKMFQMLGSIPNVSRKRNQPEPIMRLKSIHITFQQRPHIYIQSLCNKLGKILK